jgi:hypothetical protein
MATVVPGRCTADVDGEFVVFLVGMRINRLWKIHKWLPVVRAMGPMVRSLRRDPSKGMLGSRLVMGGRVLTAIQYWRSFDQLADFARNPDEPHRGAWRRFNRAVGTGGDVGIWHETFRVPAGGYECVYNNMPVFGLAAASAPAPVAERGQSAARRIGASAGDDPAEPVPAEQSEAIRSRRAAVAMTGAGESV